MAAALVAAALAGHRCSVDLQPKMEEACAPPACDFDYVCDETVPWLHYSKHSRKWAPATPPDATGCHACKSSRLRKPRGKPALATCLTGFVVADTAHKGEPPAGCVVGKHCDACANPTGKTVASVFLNGGSCTPCAPSTRRRSHEVAKRHRRVEEV